MRLWSIHPRYLDTKGLLAVWREGLLALHVLKGQTRGYLNHPQLIRFKGHNETLKAISAYLHTIVDEADARGFSFKRAKLEPLSLVTSIPVTYGQIAYETQHLKNKLKLRDKQRYVSYESIVALEVHPLFKLVPGTIETWEKIKSSHDK